jgi:Patatin-like phospholipase
MRVGVDFRVIWLWLLAVLVSFAASACAPLDRSDAVPVDAESRATIPGMTGIRYWADGDAADMIRDAHESLAREQAYLASTGHQGPLPPADFLAISGGGENGAFGAGLLVGWTAAGTRPTFKGVTGISTGALTAPFAFLGPAYDEKLREVYTSITAKDVLEPRGLLLVRFSTTPWQTMRRCAKPWQSILISPCSTPSLPSTGRAESF